MASCAIVGINWGDEGKGRMVDLLTERYDYVVRYQGGGNAGHTVVNDRGKFALHLLPSGVFRAGVVNILGNDVALDLENLWNEIETLRASGVEITPQNLKISERASILLPWHRELDALEEARLKDKKYGSTKQGIAPFYSDKYQKKTVMAGELFYPERLRAHLKDLMEWKNLIIKGVYGAEPYTWDEIENWLNTSCEAIKPYICDTGDLLREAEENGKRIMFEAQLGSLRDLDHGIYPMTTYNVSDLIVTKIITESARQVEYALVWKRNDRQTELQQEFINYVQDCMEEERRGTQPYIMPEREYFPPEDTKYL